MFVCSWDIYQLFILWAFIKYNYNVESVFVILNGCFYDANPYSLSWDQHPQWCGTALVLAVHSKKTHSICLIPVWTSGYDHQAGTEIWNRGLLTISGGSVSCWLVGAWSSSDVSLSLMGLISSWWRKVLFFLVLTAGFWDVAWCFRGGWLWF